MYKICLYCKRGFKTKPSHFERRKYCSRDCVSKAKGTKIIKCSYCKNKIKKYGKDLRANHKYYFCGIKCKGLFFRGKRLSPETEFKGKFGNWRKTPKGVHLSLQTEFKKGHKPWNTGTRNPKEKELKRLRAKLRKLRLKKIPGLHTLEEWENLKKKHNYYCALCGRKEPFKNQKYLWLTEDHIIPISKKGATNFISNIQPLCMKCNIWKRDKII
jgi:5-methylcytosine-specific restriction endonuclease McrA